MKKYLITVNGARYEVEVELLEDDQNSLYPNIMTPPEHLHTATREAHEAYSPSEYKPAPKHIAGSKELTCPINGTVIEILVQPGSTVKEKDIVASIEAMKMKTSVFSSQFGIVKSIDVKVGDVVDNGQVILTFE